MSKGLGISGSICLSDIPKEQFTKGTNGKTYLNFTQFISDEADKYGNHGGITLQQTQEEREAKAKKTYIGNVKGFWSSETDFQFLKGNEEKELVQEAKDDDLPF